MKVVMDTSFLITSVKFKIDFFTELSGNKLFVPDKVIEELKYLSKNKGKKGTNAKVALKIIKSRRIDVLEADNNVDDSLVSFGREGYAIATQDIKLKRKLKKENVKLIYVKQKKYVKIG